MTHTVACWRVPCCPVLWFSDGRRWRDNVDDTALTAAAAAAAAAGEQRPISRA